MPDAVAATRSLLEDERALRRAAALVGEDSPMRPPAIGSASRPSSEFGVVLGRLTDAFAQIREAIDQVDARVQDSDDRVKQVGAGVKSVGIGVASLGERVDLANQRLAGFETRMLDLEVNQVESLGQMHVRVMKLTRQVAFALGMSVTIGALAVAALVFAR
jgi:hypothetical protein